MSDTQYSCIDANTALDLFAGGLCQADASNIRQHLDECNDCRKVLSSLARSQRSREDQAAAHREDLLPPLLPHPGMKIGRYEVLRLVGIGGMGLVYAAQDPKLDRKVALKLLRPAMESHLATQTQLIRESKIMAGLHNSSIATIYDVGEWQGRIFVALEYAEGGTLKDWIELGPKDWQEVRDRFAKAGQGLAAAHQLGVIHGDFKPANVLLTANSELRVCDFGLAQFSDERELGQPGDEPSEAEDGKFKQIAGTPAYMAPEQFQGARPSEKSDQFSFCVALHEGLYGERPFQGTSVSELSQAISEGRYGEIPSNSTVPAWLHAILRRGLSCDPDLRFPTMSDLLHALESGATNRRQQKWLAAALVGGATVALLTSLLLYKSYGSDDSVSDDSVSDDSIDLHYEGAELAASEFLDEGRISSAQHSAEEAYERAREVDQPDLMVRALILLQQTTSAAGHNNPEFFREAARLSQQISDPNLRSLAMARLAIASDEQSSDQLWDLASSAAQATEADSESRDYLSLVTTGEAVRSDPDNDAFVENMGTYLKSLAHYSSAGKAEPKTDPCEAIDSLQIQAACYSLQASQELVSGNMEKGLALSDTAVTLFSRVEGGDPCYLANALFMRGGAYLEIDPIKAERDFFRSLTLCPDEKATTLAMWALSLAENGKFAKAKKALSSDPKLVFHEEDSELLAHIRQAIREKTRPSLLE